MYCICRKVATVRSAYYIPKHFACCSALYMPKTFACGALYKRKRLACGALYILYIKPYSSVLVN